MTQEIKLKLMSGSKVILANCPGYESELFVPVIINKRIVLQNVVISRQCCNHSLFGSGNSVEKGNLSAEFLKKLTFPNQVPLANSTPTLIRNSCKENIRNSIESHSYHTSQFNLPTGIKIKPLGRSENLKTRMPDKIARVIPTPSANASDCGKNTCDPLKRFPTPDIVRRAAVKKTNETIPLPVYPQLTELKVLRLHRVNTGNTPKNLAKIVSSKTPLRNTSSPRILRNLSNLSSFGSPPSLHLTKQRNTFDCGSPNQSFLVGRIKTPDTVTKWRKCITPKRTYIRHSNGQKQITKIEPLELANNGKLVDSNIFPRKIKSQVIIKRRKLIIDSNMKITPKKFKKQLQNTEDLHRNKFELPKSRRHFYLSHMTAFDLLTNSSFYPKLGKKLNTVFRQGCVNKQAATIFKYKQLTEDINFDEDQK